MPKITIIKIIHFTIDFLLAGYHIACVIGKHSDFLNHIIHPEQHVNRTCNKCKDYADSNIFLFTEFVRHRSVISLIIILIVVVVLIIALVVILIVVVVLIIALIVILVWLAVISLIVILVWLAVISLVVILVWLAVISLVVILV